MQVHCRTNLVLYLSRSISMLCSSWSEDIYFKDDVTFFPHLGVSLMQWLPWLLRMERPGKPKLTLKSMIINNKIQTLEKADR